MRHQASTQALGADLVAGLAAPPAHQPGSFDTERQWGQSQPCMQWPSPIEDKCAALLLEDATAVGVMVLLTVVQHS